MTFEYPYEVVKARAAEREAMQSELAALRAEVERLRTVLVAITYDLSDVGALFDGHDELNEFTHEDNAKHMEGALDRINEIAREALVEGTSRQQDLCIYKKAWEKLKEILHKNSQDGVVDDSWIVSLMYQIEKELNDDLGNSK